MAKATHAKSKARQSPLNVPPHVLRAGQRRLDWLQLFWRAEKANQGRPRWKVADEVVAAIKARQPDAPVSAKSMQTWERKFREAGGLAGLATGSGRKSKRATVIQDGQKAAAEMSPAELIAEAIALLRVASARLVGEAAGDTTAGAGEKSQ